MILDHAKLGLTFTFMKDFASVVTLSFLPKTLIWNKMAFLASNSLKLAGLAVNPLKKTIFKNIYQYSNIYQYLTIFYVFLYAIL